MWRPAQWVVFESTEGISTPSRGTAALPVKGQSYLCETGLLDHYFGGLYKYVLCSLLPIITH